MVEAPRVLITHTPYTHPYKLGRIDGFELRNEAKTLEYVLGHRIPAVEAAYFGYNTPLTTPAAHYYDHMFMEMQGRFNPTHFVMLIGEQRLHQTDPIFDSHFAQIADMFKKPTLIASFTEPPMQQIITPTDRDKETDYAYIAWKGWKDVRECVLEFISRENSEITQPQLPITSNRLALSQPLGSGIVRIQLPF